MDVGHTGWASQKAEGIGLGTEQGLIDHEPERGGKHFSFWTHPLIPRGCAGTCRGGSWRGPYTGLAAFIPAACY